jgi:hypothetical protein
MRLPLEGFRLLGKLVVTCEVYDKGHGAVLELFTDQRKRKMEEADGIANQPDSICRRTSGKWYTSLTKTTLSSLETSSLVGRGRESGLAAIGLLINAIGAHLADGPRY